MKKVHLSLHKFVPRQIQFVENRRSSWLRNSVLGRCVWSGFHHGLGCHSNIQGQGGYDTLTTVIATIRFHIIKSSLVMTNMSTMRATATIMMRMTRMRMRMMRKMMMRTRTSRWMRWYDDVQDVEMDEMIRRHAKNYQPGDLFIPSQTWPKSCNVATYN